MLRQERAVYVGAKMEGYDDGWSDGVPETQAYSQKAAYRWYIDSSVYIQYLMRS
jgi:hypothetical protein